jgi:hypothetical protein
MNDLIKYTKSLVKVGILNVHLCNIKTIFLLNIIFIISLYNISMRNACVSIILIIILLLILVCMLKQKKNHTDSVYRQYMINNDINDSVGKIFLQGWFSGILVKDEERLFQMIHPKVQINTYIGNGSNALEVIEIIKKIDVLPNYKITKYNMTLTNHNMVITHEVLQSENNSRYTSIMTLAKDSYLKWKVMTWSYFKV